MQRPTHPRSTPHVWHRQTIPTSPPPSLRHHPEFVLEACEGCSCCRFFELWSQVKAVLHLSSCLRFCPRCTFDMSLDTSQPTPRVPTREYPNLMLRVRRAMRLCEISMFPARSKYVELFCALRTMQGAAIHPRKDVARIMVTLLQDWQHGGADTPSPLLKAATLNLERKMCRQLCLQFPAVSRRLLQQQFYISQVCRLSRVPVRRNVTQQTRSAALLQGAGSHDADAQQEINLRFLFTYAMSIKMRRRRQRLRQHPTHMLRHGQRHARHNACVWQHYPSRVELLQAT